jgi:predicted DsbA family dithiol-disulfide isomerase
VRAIQFYYDVVCPYSYLETHAIDAAEDAGEVTVAWLPFELRPAPRPLLEPRGDHLRVDWTQNVYRHAQRLGIEIHLPRYQPRSTLPLAACLWAGEQERLRAFKHALYEAFFCEGEDIATDRELARAAARAGLDADGAVAAAYSPDRFEQIATIRRAAESAGIRGVPSLLDEQGENHWGMGGLERLLRGQPLVPRSA